MYTELTLESHVALLHDGTRYGNVIYRSPDGEGQHWQLVRPEAPSLLPPSWEGGRERFVLPNEYSWCQESLLRSLTSCYVDIDRVTDESIALAALDAADVPRPSMVVHSGSGMHFYWRLVRAPTDALPGWKRAQNRLHEVLSDLLPRQIVDGKEIRFGELAPGICTVT